MEKKVKVVNGEKFYLLGKRKEDNKNVWLQNANFDCSWYWGVGYIEIFNNKNDSANNVGIIKVDLYHTNIPIYKDIAMYDKEALFITTYQQNYVMRLK